MPSAALAVRPALARLGVSPAAAALLALVLAALVFGQPDRASIVIGGAIALLGEALRVAAAGYGYKLGELTVQGPYRFVRHPYFLGTAILHLGVCVTSRNVYVMAAGIVLVTLLHRRRFRADETRLRRSLGPAFDDYAAQVPAFLPQLVPAPPTSAEKRRFSLKLAVLTGRHRELDALLGLVLVYVLFELLARNVAPELLRPAIVITTGAYATFRLFQSGLARRRRRSQ